MDDLKPCPFCGQEAMISYNSVYDFQAYCTNDSCFMSQIVMDGMETEEQAKAAWNKRVPSDPAVPLEPLANWLAEYAAPPVSECCVTADERTAAWKAVLNKFVEEQHDD